MIDNPIIHIPGISMGHRSNATVRERLGSARKHGVTKLNAETRLHIGKPGIIAGFVEIPRRQCFADTTSEFDTHA
ncbi:hypothetical protein [Agrobacterium arsenijevicii]|uniref:hypothetical protein n=1 Tax=Agrobacterium arsenijevicii TaxID=1585697 RepID=UPI0011128890